MTLSLKINTEISTLEINKEKRKDFAELIIFDTCEMNTNKDGKNDENSSDQTLNRQWIEKDTQEISTNCSSQDRCGEAYFSQSAKEIRWP